MSFTLQNLKYKSNLETKNYFQILQFRLLFLNPQNSVQIILKSMLSQTHEILNQNNFEKN